MRLIRATTALRAGATIGLRADLRSGRIRISINLLPLEDNVAPPAAPAPPG